MLKNFVRSIIRKRIPTRIAASTLILTLTFVNVMLLVSYFVPKLNSYASSNLEAQTDSTSSPKVKFDAYFIEGEAKTHSITGDISGAGETLYLDLHVLDGDVGGYLKDATIQIKDANGGLDTNFSIIETPLENNVANVDLLNKKIDLKQVNSGTQAVIEVKTALRGAKDFDLDYLGQDSKIILKGTYVNGQGVQTTLDEVRTINTNWKGTSEVEASQEIVRYVPYNDGVMIQFLVKTAVKDRNVETNNGLMKSLPIQKTTITAKAPTFNGIGPIVEDIKVTAGNTYITNGKDGDNVGFTNENWHYDATTEEVKITVENNPNSENKVWGSFGDSQFDEYYITYIYPKAARDLIGTNEIIVTSPVNAKIEYYKNSAGTNSGVSAKDITTSFALQHPNNAIGNMVGFKINSPNKNIQKGFMYNNFENSAKSITEYKVNWTASIAYANLISGILMTQNENLDVYKSSSGNVNAVNGTNTVYYKETSIAKNTFDRILGEDGYIRILDASNGNIQIGIIDKNTIPTQDGYLVANYAANNEAIYNIKVETSAPIMEGDLKITHSKAIRTNLENVYDINKVKQFEYLNSYVKGAVKFGTAPEYTDVNTAEKDIKFVKPYTKATLKMDKERYSSTNLNKDVKLQVVLQRDAIELDLYKNPIIQIELPEYIEKIDIKGTPNVLYSDGLTLGNITLNGNILTMPFSGNQTEYRPTQVGGTIIELTADLKVKPTTPTTVSTANLYVYNEKASSYDNETNYSLGNHNSVGLYSAPVTFAAPTGMIAYSNIENYNATGNIVTSLESQNNVGLIDHLDASKIATMRLGLVNNYGSNCSDIQLLGRIPFSYNKSTDSNVALGSTFNTVLKNAISQTGVDSGNVVVYYSTNGEATKDLTNPANAWTTDTTNLTNVKSYLIVLENYTMSQGEEINFSYDFEIPQNMALNEEAYGIFSAYFNYDAQGTAISGQATSEKVGIATKKGAKLEVVQTANVQNNAEVTEYQIIKYTIKVKNVGQLPAENLVISNEIPNGTTYGSYEETGLDFIEFVPDNTVTEIHTSPITLVPGATATKEIFVKVNKLPGAATTDEIENVAKVTATDIVQESNKMKNAVAKADLLVEAGGLVKDGSGFFEGENIVYSVNVKNVTENALNNVVVKDYLPEGVTLEDAYIISSAGRERTNVTYDENTRLLTFNLGTLAPDEEKDVEFVASVNDIEDESLQRTIVNKATVSSDTTVMRNSNEITYYVTAPKIEITQTSNVTTRQVNELQEIVYTIKVKNTGAGPVVNAIITNKIPEGMLLKSHEPQAAVSSKADEIQWSVGSIQAGETLEFKFTVMVPILAQGVDNKAFTNKAEIQASNIKKMASNEVVHELIREAESNFKISGTAWIDENKDGQRQSSEELFKDITVILVDANTGDIIKDKDTGVEKTGRTGADGKYVFENLENNREYIVVFIFNSKAYRITIGAIGKTINLNGASVQGAITDKLRVEDTSLYDIDIGLVENPNFDFSLSKYVNKVIVQNREGTKVIDYTNTQLAKVDIKDSYMPGSIITIEYKLVVENKGDVPGYVKKIVDNLPSDVEFNASNNQGWTKEADGKLYYTGIENSEINPGSSKEISLTVTKTLTSSSTINIANTVEIYEDENALGAMDINSTPNNGVQAENDYSRAETLITVKTGEAAMYFVLGFTIVTMLGIGIYFIKRKVL